MEKFSNDQVYIWASECEGAKKKALKKEQTRTS